MSDKIVKVKWKLLKSQCYENDKLLNTCFGNGKECSPKTCPIVIKNKQKEMTDIIVAILLLIFIIFVIISRL